MTHNLLKIIIKTTAYEEQSNNVEVQDNKQTNVNPASFIWKVVGN